MQEPVLPALLTAANMIRVGSMKHSHIVGSHHLPNDYSADIAPSFARSTMRARRLDFFVIFLELADAEGLVVNMVARSSFR